MWRNFCFAYMTIVGKLKISPPVDKFQYNWWGFIAVYADLLLNLLFTLFCREIFATIYALSCGEKLIPKVHLRREKWQISGLFMYEESKTPIARFWALNLSKSTLGFLILGYHKGKSTKNGPKIAKFGQNSPESEIYLPNQWFCTLKQPFSVILGRDFGRRNPKSGVLLLRHWYEIMALYYVKSI